MVQVSAKTKVCGKMSAKMWSVAILHWVKVLGLGLC